MLFYWLVTDNLLLKHFTNRI